MIVLVFLTKETPTFLIPTPTVSILFDSEE